MFVFLQVRLTLEEYVNRPDPAYTYREVKRTEDLHNSVFYLNMTSQKWMDGKQENNTFAFEISLLFPELFPES